MNPSPFSSRPFGTSNPSRHLDRAFSLLELVLALGILSFALIGILALLPLALTRAQDSQIETRIASLAQSLFSDLRSRHGLQTRPQTPFDPTVFPMSGTQVSTLHYDREGQLLAPEDAGVFYTVLVTLEKAPVAFPGGYQATVKMTWPGGRSIPLTSLLR